MDFQLLKYNVKNQVAEVRFNRPPANALDTTLVDELHLALDALETDSEVRAVVFTGQGPFFIGGADIKMMQDHKGPELPAFMEAFTVHLQRVINRIEVLPKPVIAAVNGFAAGGGCELALACDFRFMATGKARIGLPEVKLGLLPGGGGLQRMPRLVGLSKAIELMVMGRLVSAEEALEIGLVNRIYAPDVLMAETLAFAEKLATQATMAIGVIKGCVNHGLDATIRDGLSFDIDAQDNLFKSRDGMEGIEAFVNKRPAVFHGR